MIHKLNLQLGLNLPLNTKVFKNRKKKNGMK